MTNSFNHLSLSFFPSRCRGFTLAELLIALMILAIISIFTIPKLLSAQQNNNYKAGAKEAAGTLTTALTQLRYSGSFTGSTRVAALTSYINYVKIDTVSQIDGGPTEGAPYDCATMGTCLKMSNGAILLLFDFGGGYGLLGDNVDDFNFFAYDPDGKLTGKWDTLWLMANPKGRIKSWDAELASDSVSGGAGVNGNSTFIPAWFTWN